MDGLASFRQWEVVEISVDRSKPATGRTLVRLGHHCMVADYHAGMFTAIICYCLDRLSRQLLQLEDWIDAAELKGLALVTSNGEADLSADSDRRYARIKAAFACAEMERKGARQSAAQLLRAKQGRAPKGMRPLGYVTNGVVIPDEVEAVRAIYAMSTRATRPESLWSMARGLCGTQRVTSLMPRPEHSHVVSSEKSRATSR
ncbi:recombinase family protein [Schaalia georgiae]|uniref:recombinase family protein n=1 Tax=Schaalia georgiae TaxID=52768 RepID=UPI000684749F|nr:recombinase family protein [Schaalia georgiae]